MVDSPNLNDASLLIETKFYVPRWRTGFVSRPRLCQFIDRGAESKLTLVSAPAGFGKTTLLAEWLAQVNAGDQACAWLSLDEGDNHPSRFWTYVIAALRTVKPGLGASALSVLQSPQPVLETVLASLINEIGAAAQDFVLVLDDYHVIDAAPVHDSVGFLLEHLPANLRVVITSRSDPPLPLARLRGGRELTEVRAADLRFLPEEVAAFMKDAMELDFSAENLVALEAKTEGWIAGLQLAALSMRGRDEVDAFVAALAGDDRYIVDYLVEEVLEHQSTSLRRFLLRTSVLDRLSGPLCDAVTEEQDGKATLERLERGNVFVVPLDDRRRWYRYHHLFADVLQSRLEEELPGEVAALHRRASEWYEQAGEPSNAIRHAFAAGDPERAAGLVEAIAEATLLRYEPAVLLEWLGQLPGEVLRARPVLSTYYAFALGGVGEMEAAAVPLRYAEQWVNVSYEQGQASSAGMVVGDQAAFRAVPGLIALARAYSAQARGDLAMTQREANRALELLPETARLWRVGPAVLLALSLWGRGELAGAQSAHDAALADLEESGVLPLAVGAACDGAALRVARGQLSEARRFSERWLNLVQDRGGQMMLGVADLHLGLSTLYWERGDLEAAREHLQQGEDLGLLATLPETPFRRLVVQARLKQAEGDLTEALALLEAAEGLHVRGPVPEVWAVGALKGRLWLAQDRLEEAMDWVRGSGLSVEDAPEYLRESEHITLAHVLIAQGQRTADEHLLEDAIGLLDRLLAVAQSQERVASTIDILIALALAHAAQKDLPVALERIDLALTLAEPEGYLRTFIDRGKPMRDLLGNAVSGGRGGDYARRLLEAFEPQKSVRYGSSIDQLTAREVEILRLLASGMRNQEIADSLVISIATVKRHVANAYEKLGVNHRTEALLRARELNLL